MISDAQRQPKRRAEKKKVISEMSNQSTSNASKLRKFTHASSGRPPLKDAYPQLHPAIVELATARAGANFRSRTDVLNACKNLDDLHAGLLKEIIFWAANLCISVLFQEDQTQSKENVMSGQFLLTLERHKTPFETFVSQRNSIWKILLLFLVQRTCLFYLLTIKRKCQ